MRGIKTVQALANDLADEARYLADSDPATWTPARRRELRSIVSDLKAWRQAIEDRD